MSRAAAWLVHGANLLVGGSGLAYAWMLYLMEPADEFAVVNHPLQPEALHLHVLAAPLLVFACGLVWSQHAWARARSGFRPHRPTGLLLVGLFGPMAASGYLLQVTEDQGWRSLWTVAHLATSLVWLLAYLGHLVSRRPLTPRGS